MFYENRWFKTAVVILFLLIFFFFLVYSVKNHSFHNLIRALTEKSFPFEMVILEGIPGYSQPERERIESMRCKAMGLGLYLLTGVNISDARTYFLSYYAPPKEGPPWLGWAYYPDDPEMEGPILEPLDDPFSKVEPAPITSSNDVLVGIYHTHNGESYAGGGGVDRVSPGENGDVVKFGKALSYALERKGIKTVHSDTVNDKVYAMSYDSSYNIARNMLEENPTIRILLDIHRDGIPSELGKSTVKIGDRETAKILIVLGQKNPYWEKNNEIAEKLIQIGEEKYPGLFSARIRYASKARYNQHLSDGALLLEVGSQLNTLEEALNAVEPLAEVLKEYLER